MMIFCLVVRAVIDQISAALCGICNKSFQTGVFPDKLKWAKIIPVFKSENKSLLINYRPISVLPLFSKILERWMHIRITEFIIKNEILSENQYDFRDKRSTYTVLFQLIDRVICELDTMQYSSEYFWT